MLSKSRLGLVEQLWGKVARGLFLESFSWGVKPRHKK